jgi:cytochrome c oxidase subunit III
LSDVADNLIPYRPPGVQRDYTAYLGMVFFLASWAMMFAGLFFSYGVIRARAPVWPPLDQPVLPLLLPALNTVVIAASSGAMLSAVSAIRRNDQRRATLGLAATTLLAFVFLGLQLRLWSQLQGAGLHASGSPYASVFYGLTGLHALHVAVGLIALCGLTWKSSRGAFAASRYRPVRLWGMYWHFVGVVWALMFVSVFLL